MPCVVLAGETVARDRHLGCFQVLAITNSAAMNIVEQMLLWYDRASLWYIAKSGIAES